MTSTALFTGDMGVDRVEVAQQIRAGQRKRRSFGHNAVFRSGHKGLDYQFCDCIVNYDLPWNPMKMEQRIGRIDRWGQKR